MKILIAEDDAVSRLMLGRTLQQWGHEVIAASNGEEAWARFTAEPCQFVITDWMMPETDGLELCRRIRALEGRDYTYVILLTARSQKGDLIEGMSAGADDFIAKPFDVEELEVRIRAGERVVKLEHSLNERNKQIQAINNRLTRWVQREHALNQVARALGESLEVDDVLQAAVLHLQELSQASRAFTMLLDLDRQSLQVASEHCFFGVDPIGARSFPVEETTNQSGHLNSVLVVHDLDYELKTQPSAFASRMSRDFGVRSLLSVPIVHQGQWLGIIGLHQCHEMRCWEDDEVSLVRAIAQQMGVALANARLYHQVQEQAVRDGLTGLYNRRHFDQTLAHEFERARRFGHTLSLVMVDLDHLKQINDQFGHQAGDAAIREVGDALIQHTRRLDVAARYGGEEFAVILVETQSPGAFLAANSWREAIRERTVANGHRLSASLGVATYPTHAKTAEDLIKAADQALYRAKRAGRDCVCLADLPQQEAKEIGA
jgi:diguanylate cyclase (GGDEF)-like protein